jgi:hypothetical protein
LIKFPRARSDAGDFFAAVNLVNVILPDYNRAI